MLQSEMDSRETAVREMDRQEVERKECGQMPIHVQEGAVLGASNMCTTAHRTRK